MSRIYDSWERLVAAVVKRQQLWQLFHEHSRSPSLSSGYQSEEEDDNGSGTTIASPSSPREQDLKIEVPNIQVDRHGVSFKYNPHTKENYPNLCRRIVGPTPSRTTVVHYENKTNWPDDPARQSFPLPLPPVTISSSSPFSRPTSAATSPSLPVHNPGRRENVKFSNSSWKRGKSLGRGAIGGVYIGYNSESGEVCVMKEFTLSLDAANSRQSAVRLEKEIELLSGLRHPNVAEYYGSEVAGDKLCVYLEYVSGGSVYNILQEYGKFGEPAIRSCTQQILSGLVYLHSKSTPHRDIRGANVLVDPKGCVKLSRFGIGEQFVEQSRTSLHTDSFYWMAPEVIMNPNASDLAMDMWSLGCTVLEMATSRPPMSHYEGVLDSILQDLKIGHHKRIPKIPNHLSDECKDFLTHCLQWNPLHRATASELLEHPFVKSVTPLDIPMESFSFWFKDMKRRIVQGVDQARNLYQLNSMGPAIDSSRTSKS